MDAIKPECQWVLDGEGIATVKLDGTNVKVEHGQLLKRQKPKERDYDDAAYIPCNRDEPSDRWAWEAFDAGSTTHVGPLIEPPDDGIYELVGPKIQGNPQQHAAHTLVRVVPPSRRVIIPDEAAEDLERTFVGLRNFLEAHPIEGVVFHHPDGRMAKIKRRDFGLAWPIVDAKPTLVAAADAPEAPNEHL
jgi:hypothetical protein